MPLPTRFLLLTIAFVLPLSPVHADTEVDNVNLRLNYRERNAAASASVNLVVPDARTSQQQAVICAAAPPGTSISSDDGALQGAPASVKCDGEAFIIPSPQLGTIDSTVITVHAE